MKVHELLAVYRSLFVGMSRQGVNQDDIIYIDIHREYIQMLASGQKEAEIWAFLSSKHKLSASTIKRAVRRLDEEYEL